MRVGSCEVLSEIGAGGMGKVYKARDTRLGREVAVKVLPEAFAADPERMARLEREARILASLNHPNIAAIFSLEEGALVMEYVEGPTLDERIARGPIPLEEALPIARQMAEALAYAHERGVIHRDLKPANVKLTAEGDVKVLDFGLAKALEGEAAPADPETSPTLTIAATRAGLILGTAAYMSPEQARGKPADKRADIWSFGIVLYEMFSCRRLFDADNVSDTLASVLKEPIDWSPLPAQTPPPVRRLLRRCLQRDRRKRLQDIGDALHEIDEAQQGGFELPAASGRPAILPWILGALLVVAVAMAIAGWWRSGRPEQPLMRLDVDLGSNAALAFGPGSNAILSPDGTRLVYVVNGPDGKSQLAALPLDGRDAVVLAGTEDARNPFFSPDGQWAAFFAGGKLRKIAVTGGSAVVLCDSGTPLGGSWAEDGSIVAALHSNEGIWRIASGGGPPVRVTEPDRAGGENSHRWPQILPGGEAILFTAGNVTAFEETASAVVQSLTNHRRKTLWRGGYYGRYLASGHLVYVQQDALYAVRFDSTSWKVEGKPVAVVNGVASLPAWGAAQFDFSSTGTFIFAGGKPAGSALSLVWLDSAGKLQPLRAPPGNYHAPRLAPDGKRVIVWRNEGGSSGLWLYDWPRDIMNRLTVAGVVPVWSAGGAHLAFASRSDPGRAANRQAHEIQWIRADGSNAPRRLVQSRNRQYPFSMSPDGKTLAFVE